MTESEERDPRPLSESKPRDRTSLRFYEAFNARDFATMEALSAPDIEFIDRRQGLNTSFVGREAQMEQLRVMTELGMYQLPNIVLGEHGRKQLLDVTWTNRDPDAAIEVRTLMVVEESEGSVRRLWIFDPDDIGASKACLEA